MIKVKNITPPTKIDWRERVERLKSLRAPSAVIQEAEQKAGEIGEEISPPAFHKRDREYPAPRSLKEILNDFVYKVSPSVGKSASWSPFWELTELLLNGVPISPSYPKEIILQDGDVVEVVVELSGD